jgi:hypothetical protein
MALVSYVFTVNPNRQVYYLPGGSNIEVKAIAASNMEVSVADVTLTQTCPLFRNDVRMGTSIVIGPNSVIGFENRSGSPATGYLGAIV